MSFMMPPRSRSPVFSISTEPDEMHVLRAQIEAANTQQKYAKRHNPKSCRGSPFDESLQSPDTLGQYEYPTRALRKATNESMTDTISLRSPNRSSKGIGGTIRGELSSAKDLIKSTSRKHLQRLRTRTTRHSTTNSVSTLSPEAPISSGPNFVELSCEPLMAQLEDTQRSMGRSPTLEKSLPSSYQSSAEISQQDTASNTDDHETVVLSKKEYSCDSCQQHLTGKDFYDFCPLCDPSDRVLCMGCASRGGCWRHGQERMAALAPPSLCGSPAPSYNHNYPTTERYKQSPILRKSVPSRASYVPTPVSYSTHDEEQQTTSVEQPMNARLSNSGSGRRRLDEKPALVAQLQHDFLREVNQTAHQLGRGGNTEKSIADREASLRDQQASIREQQISLREQSLLQRERENVARERDALFIQNLQTLALQGLVRGQQLGPQLQACKGDGLEAPEVAIDMKRSKSSSSQGSDISLDTEACARLPRESLGNVVAAVEASISGGVSGDKHVRACAEKRKKAETSAGNNASSTQQKSSGGKQKSKHLQQNDDNKETNEDGEDDLTPPKRQKKNDPEQESPRRNFACPYCKYDSQKYSPKNLLDMKYRNCSSHYLPSIARVKQHLQRVHWRPENHCPRCFEIFKSAGELQEHFAVIDGCSVRECPFPEKMDKIQRQRIHVKRPNMPSEALWYDIYKVLFPGAILPDSPYADEETSIASPSASASVRTSDDAAQLLHQVFNEGLDRYADRFDQSLRDLLNRVLEESMSTVFSKVSLSPTPSPGAQNSRTSSTTISPVTPSLPRKPQGARVEAKHSDESGSAPPKGKVFFGGMHMNSVPQLQNPVRQHLAPALDPSMAAHAARMPATDITDHDTDMLRMPSPVRPDPFVRPTMPVQQNLPLVVNNPSDAPVTFAESLAATTLFNLNDKSSVEMMPDDAGTHVLDAGFDWHVPAHIREDQGYDDECNSFEEGDDQHAMAERIQMRHAGKSGTSIYSPVDSGYGSGNSIHPRRHASKAGNVPDVFDTDSGTNSATFMQHYHEWETMEQERTQYDWQSHIGRAI